MNIVSVSASISVMVGAAGIIGEVLLEPSEG